MTQTTDLDALRVRLRHLFVMESRLWGDGEVQQTLDALITAADRAGYLRGLREVKAMVPHTCGEDVCAHAGDDVSRLVLLRINLRMETQ